MMGTIHKLVDSLKKEDCTTEISYRLCFKVAMVQGQERFALVTLGSDTRVSFSERGSIALGKSPADVAQAFEDLP